MTSPSPISILLLIVAASVFAPKTYACEPPTILAPAAHQVLRTSKPTIAWLSASTTDAHELEVIARIPEGEVLQRVQRIVHGQQWQPDTALANRDAVISLRVTRRCADQRSASTERIFHLSFAGACPTPSYMSPTKVGRFLRVEWKKVHPIKALEIRNFFGEKASPGESATTDRTPALIQLSGQAAETVGIRAQCEEGLSDWVWVPVASP